MSQVELKNFSNIQTNLSNPNVNSSNQNKIDTSKLERTPNNDVLVDKEGNSSAKKKILTFAGIIGATAAIGGAIYALF